MTLSLDVAISAALLARLRADAGLAALVETIDTGDDPVRTVPAVTIGPCLGEDWGAKDREGAELRIGITVHERSDDPRSGGAAARRVVELLNDWPASPDAVVDGWRVVAVRVVRTRIARTRDGTMTAVIDARLRCWND